MCLVLFSFDLHPEYQYIVAGNRDEFYARPAQPLGFWKDEPLILGEAVYSLQRPFRPVVPFYQHSRSARLIVSVRLIFFCNCK